MKEEVKGVIESVKTRYSDPIIGPLITSYFVWNYELILIVLFGDDYDSVVLDINQYIVLNSYFHVIIPFFMTMFFLYIYPLISIEAKVKAKKIRANSEDTLSIVDKNGSLRVQQVKAMQKTVEVQNKQIASMEKEKELDIKVLEKKNSFLNESLIYQIKMSVSYMNQGHTNSEDDYSRFKGIIHSVEDARFEGDYDKLRNNLLVLNGFFKNRYQDHEGIIIEKLGRP